MRRGWGHPELGSREDALALEQVDGLREVGDPQVPGQGRVLALEG